MFDADLGAAANRERKQRGVRVFFSTFTGGTGLTVLRMRPSTPYIFGNFQNAHTQSDLTASAMIRQYIVNFAARGDPNAPGLPQWDRFEETTQRAMVFDRVFHCGEWPNLAALQALTPYLKCYAGMPLTSNPE